MQHSHLLSIAALVATTIAPAAWSHVTLDQPQAPAGSTYKAVLKVGHTCEGAALTTSITARLPAGFQGAKPVPKAGWTTTVRRAPLAQPYDNHGHQVTEDVVEVRWQANSPETALPGDFYDEFTVRGQLPGTAGLLWFKVLQSCDKGEIDWAQIPAAGTSTKGLSAPAAPLEVVADPHAGHHQH